MVVLVNLLRFFVDSGLISGMSDPNTNAEVVLFYKCDQCKKVIQNPKDGFVIQGNIYVADPARIGGLVGDNIVRQKPESQEPKCSLRNRSCNRSFCRYMSRPNSNTGAIIEVKKNVFCVDCLYAALLIKKGSA
jgi:hypothetical protein